MYRVLIAECRQEVSTFNPVPSQTSDFTLTYGQAIIDNVEGTMHELVGALAVFRSRPDIQLVPGFSARQRTSGGTLSAESFAQIAKDFLGSVRANRDVDGIYFVLHGAMAVEGEDDPEGYLLAEARAIVGEDTPIVASFDLHGIITDRILTHCDAISIYHTYPHVDFEDTGARAAKLLLDLLDGKIKPITARVRIPALVRGNELITETGLFGGMIRAAQAASAQAPGLAGGMFIGNPFTDVSDLSSSVIITSDNDADYASQQALAIAHEFWAVREQLQQPLITLEEAVQQTKQNTQGTVVLVDAADATSSGASGDSNAILRVLIAADYQGRLLTTVVDEQAVQAAFEAGIGSLIHTSLGGQLDSVRFTPLPVEAKVHLLSEGVFINESWGSYWDAGLTAVLHVEQHVVVVTSKPVHLFDRSLYLAHGQNPQNFDAVVVKSPHCQPQFYADWAALMLNVDAPGSTSANLPYLGHSACQRPIFPLDPDVEFVPQVRLFQRSRFR